MKKMVALVVALCTAALGFTACSIPNAGKLEIIKSPTVAAGSQEAASETQDDSNETDMQEETGQPEATPEPAADPEPTEGMSKAEVEALVQEGVVPKEAVNSDGEATTYDNQKIADALQKCADNITCKTIMIGGNNVVVQAVNNNDVTIPKLSVVVTVSDAEQTYDFYQVKAAGEVLIPISKGSGELPPAVSAKTVISMTANEYTNIADQLEFTPSMTDTQYKLAVKNNSDKACKRLSITAKLYSGSTVVYTELVEKSEALAPGSVSSFEFTLPDSMAGSGVSFDKADFVVNEAAA